MNIWGLFGFLSLFLGGIGIILPLLPTTPFVLLAAWCFAKSSPRLHNWLLENRIFGPLIRRWDENRCIPLKAKLMALTMVAGFGGSSVYFFVPAGWLKILAGSFVAIGFLSVLRLKVCDDRQSDTLEMDT